MINRDRVVKLIGDLNEWNIDFLEAIKAIDNCTDEKINKLLYHSIRAYFLDFHILCEDFISISLKRINKFKIDISAIDGMDILKKENIVSEEFFKFYSISRRLRNRLAHRYKLPKDEELLINIKNNYDNIEELIEATKRIIE